MDTHCVSRSLQLSTFLNKQQHCRYKKRCCHLQTLCGTCLGPESWLSLLSHLAYPEQLSTAKMSLSGTSRCEGQCLITHFQLFLVLHFTLCDYLFLDLLVGKGVYIRCHGPFCCELLHHCICDCCSFLPMSPHYCLQHLRVQMDNVCLTDAGLL